MSPRMLLLSASALVLIGAGMPSVLAEISFVTQKQEGALLKTGAENYVLRHWGTNTMAWAEDDLEIVQSMAQNAGLGLPQAGLNRELCRTLKPKRFELDKYGV